MKGRKVKTVFREVPNSQIREWPNYLCECGWSGPQPQCVHTYWGVGCPKCFKYVTETLTERIGKR